MTLQLHDYQLVARDFLRGRDRAAQWVCGTLTPMLICEGCGTEFQPDYPGKKYHSHSCYLKHVNSDSARQSAKGKLGGAIRGQQMKSSASGKGYVKSPGKQSHEHRDVAEKVLGRKLHPREVVHHEDLNKQNNHPDNLIVFVSQAQHARHHKLLHPGLAKCDCYGIRLKEVINHVQ